MRKITLVTLFAIVVLGTTIMYGQASRTWVSGVGDDANPCSRTAPCKTFAGAISKTAPGGEIDALDPGGFGAVTITKAITLDGGGGQVASVLVSGTNGIVVAAGVNDVVILRNLQINGIRQAGAPGINGVRFLSGSALSVEHCNIFGFGTFGIDYEATGTSQLYVTDTVLANNGTGATGGAVRVQPPAAAPSKASLSGVRMMNNAVGLKASGDSSANKTIVSVDNSRS